jgi:tetratricopeptide (TPR) repeat protein
MPPDYFVAHLALQLGRQDFWLRAAPAFWSILAVAMLYRLAGRLLGRGAGLAAALFLTTSAFHVRYAQELRPYALFGLFSLASFYFLFRALHTSRGRHWLGYVLATTGGVFSHYFILFVMAGQAVIAALWLPRSKHAAPVRSRILRFGAAAACVALSLAVTPSFGSLVDVGRVFAQGLAHPASLSDPAQDKPNQAQGPVVDRAFFEDQLLRVLSGGGHWQWVFLALVLAGMAAGLSAQPRLALALIVWAVLPAVLCVLFLIHRGTFFAVRYVTPSYFALVILIAMGAGTLVSAAARRFPRWRGLAWAVAVGVPCALSLARVSAHYHQLVKEDWRTAGLLLDSNFVPGDKVDAPLVGDALSHYAKQPGLTRLDTTDLQALDGVQERLWVVMHPYLGDARGGLQDWLDAQPSAVAYPVDEALSLYLVDNSQTRIELLDSIQPVERAITLAAIADQYAAGESPARAEAYYLRALRLDGAPRYRVAYGDLLRRTGRAEEAARAYLDALAVDSATPGALVGLGRLYLERGQVTEAIRVLEAGTALAPGDYAANYFLWKSYERLGSTGEAARYRERAVQIFPDLIEPP